MPARKRPTAEDTATARRVLLDGLARDADILELVREVAPLHPRDNTFPGEVFLHLAADALDWCGASRTDPLPLEGLRAIRGGRLHPRCRQPGGRAGAPGVPGPGPAPRPPRAITTGSGHSRSGHLAAGRPDHNVGYGLWHRAAFAVRRRQPGGRLAIGWPCWIDWPGGHRGHGGYRLRQRSYWSSGSPSPRAASIES